jgi:hypothetical protein
MRSVSYIYFQARMKRMEKTWEHVIPLQQLRASLLKPTNKQFTEIRQETRKILRLYCRKQCSSFEIRNWSGKENSNSVVSCFQRERYAHTHTHTHKTASKHGRDGFGRFVFEAWGAEIHESFILRDWLSAMAVFNYRSCYVGMVIR